MLQGLQQWQENPILQEQIKQNLQRLQDCSRKHFRLWTFQQIKNILEICDTTRLKKINLQEQPLGNNGFKIITKLNLPQIQYISMSDCKLGDQICLYLSKANWPNLKYLYLHNNPINYIGYQFLVMGRWKQKTLLSIGKQSLKDKKEYSINRVALILLLLSKSYINFGYPKNYLVDQDFDKIKFQKYLFGLSK